MTRLVYCPGVCRECGCTSEAPCPEGCAWVEDDLCSSCAPLIRACSVEVLEDEGGVELFDPFGEGL